MDRQNSLVKLSLSVPSGKSGLARRRKGPRPRWGGGGRDLCIPAFHSQPAGDQGLPGELFVKVNSIPYLHYLTHQPLTCGY